MKRALSALALLFLLGAAGCSTPDDDDYGPPYRHRWGQHHPMMGQGYGTRGPGYGMMGPGEGWGPGMMGPGMMGGYGPGMMGGWGYDIPDLTADQRTAIAQIQRDLRQKQWGLMQQMHEQAWSGDGAAQGAFDEQAARKQFDAMTAAHKQMFENALAARKRIEAVLTPQQREQLRRGRATTPPAR